MIRRQVIGGAIILGILTGLALDSYMQTHPATVTYAREPEQPREVLISAKIDWTEERVIQEIRKVFPDAPIMIKVAKCESGFKPHAYNPTNNSHDGGVLQISEKYHGEKMEDLDLDPYDVQDNLEYGRMLYDEQGLQPWSASKHCWSK